MTMYTSTGIFKKYLTSATNDELRDLKETADDAYYNTGESVLTDQNYDLLTEHIEHVDPTYVQLTGAKLRDGDNQVELPVSMRSMNKATDEKKLLAWVVKNNLDDGWVTEEKLDGVSCMLFIDGGSHPKLYTRGNGDIGSDISYMASIVGGIPIDTDDKLIIRGELIMRKDVFKENWSGAFSNARNMVSGCVNAKTLKPGTTDIHFVAYEIIDTKKSPYEQLTHLTCLGFEVAAFRKMEEDCNFTNMTKILQVFKKNSNYEIDGVIIQPDKPYERDPDKNPKYAIAFKQQDMMNIATTKVVKIWWESSRWRQLKPRVELEPVELSGVHIKFATGYNAKYIKDNKLGAGAVVNVTRSGDVIPKILEVLECCNEPDLPDVPCSWNDTKVDLIADTTDDLTRIKVICNFLDKLGCKHVGEKSIAKLYNAGYTTISDVLGADVESMSKLDRFGDKLATRTYDCIHTAVYEATTTDLIGSSGVLGFGFGKKKVIALMKDVPDLLNIGDDDLVDRISVVKGFSRESAEIIAGKIDEVKRFLRDIDSHISHKHVDDTKEKSDTGLSIVFSGFRDRDLEMLLVERGCVVGNSVTKTTDFVVVANDDFTSSTKTKKGEKLGVEIITKARLIQIYTI